MLRHGKRASKADVPGPRSLTVPVELLRHPGLSPGAKLLYQLLLDYDRAGQGCWAKQDTLARDLNVSTRSLAGYLAELEREGGLTVERTGGPSLYTPNRDPPSAWRPQQAGGHDRQILPIRSANSAEADRQNLRFSHVREGEQLEEGSSSATTRRSRRSRGAVPRAEAEPSAAAAVPNDGQKRRDDAATAHTEHRSEAEPSAVEGPKGGTEALVSEAVRRGVARSVARHLARMPPGLAEAVLDFHERHMQHWKNSVNVLSTLIRHPHDKWLFERGPDGHWQAPPPVREGPSPTAAEAVRRQQREQLDRRAAMEREAVRNGPSFTQLLHAKEANGAN